jgi:TonB family protein
MSTDKLMHSIVRSAARQAPSHLAERLEEEWLADLLAQHGTWGQLQFALGCYWATAMITHEFPTRAAAASTASAGQALNLFAHHDANFFSGRAGLVIAILGLHALAIYGFATGLGRTLINNIPAPIRGVLVPKERLDPAVLLPPPPVAFRDRPFEWPVVPLTPVNFPQETSQVGDVVTAPPQNLPPTGPSKHAVRIMGGPGAGFPVTDDFYPETSRRNGEGGVSTVRVCVDTRGRLTGPPSIVQSSGSAVLDEGALRLAKAASGHYRPTTEDQQAISDCYPYRIRFELHN